MRRGGCVGGGGGERQLTGGRSFHQLVATAKRTDRRLSGRPVSTGAKLIVRPTDAVDVRYLRTSSSSSRGTIVNAIIPGTEPRR